MRDIKTREGLDMWDDLHKLPRFNFWRGAEDEKGSVIRVPNKRGNWIHIHTLEIFVDGYQDKLNQLREKIKHLENNHAPK